jgi:hypothetical protein
VRAQGWEAGNPSLPRRTWLMTKNARPRIETIQTEAKMTDADNRDSHRTQMMRPRLQQTIDHLREELRKVDEPQFKAMLETSAEALGGLDGIQALEHKKGSHWRP